MPRLAATILLLALAAGAVAADRFPPPDFKDPHPLPSPTTPQPRSGAMETLDVLVLVVALAVATALVLLVRLRIAIFVLMVGALLYFGFYRKGCVCPIGSVQNVSMAAAGRQARLKVDANAARAAGINGGVGGVLLGNLAGRLKGGELVRSPDGAYVRIRMTGENKRILRQVRREGPDDLLRLESTYHVPWVVIAFFALPLVATLFFGRTFCGAVCPLGAIQDVVLIKPVRVPRPIEHALGLLPYVYLGAAVMFAAVGSAYVICRYDPFVGFFRLAAPWTMLVLGGSLLLIAMFVGRPYCRYLCPYGALLRHASLLSWRHASITPDKCIRCRLCEDACPYGAIKPPSDKPEGRTTGKRTLAALLAILPVLVVAGGLLGRWLAPAMARVDPIVRQAERVHLEREGLAEGATNASDAFRQTARPAGKLYEEAAIVTADYRTGATALGGFLGLVIGVKLISLSIRRRRTDYQTDRAKCLSCGRCFAACPHERVRRKRFMGPAGQQEQTQ